MKCETFWHFQIFWWKFWLLIVCRDCAKYLSNKSRRCQRELLLQKHTFFCHFQIFLTDNDFNDCSGSLFLIWRIKLAKAKGQEDILAVFENFKNGLFAPLLQSLLISAHQHKTNCSLIFKIEWWAYWNYRNKFCTHLSLMFSLFELPFVGCHRYSNLCTVFLQTGVVLLV